jgi:hypothetical protein
MTIEKRPSTTLLSRFTNLFSLVKVFLFIGFGAYFLLSPYILHEETDQFRQFLGIILILYGFFRAYRYFQNIMIKNDDNGSIEE